MLGQVEIMEADAVVVGSGPGGASMARELSRKGKKVILCEKGKYDRRFGYSLLLLAMMDGMGLTFSKEGTWVFRPKTVGGASVVFCGTAFKPPSWLKEKFGIDLETEVEELYREIPIQVLPDSLVGPAARNIMDSARALGLDWKLLDKFIRPERCKPNCGKCALGCPEPGAKWTAREYIEEGMRNGIQLLMRTRVDRVLSENGTAVGVRAKGPNGWLDIRADTVILSAGGQGTPPILQRSGLYDAGQGFIIDPMVYVMGKTSRPGNLHEVPMTAGVNLTEDGILLAEMMPPPMMCLGLLAFSGTRGWVSLPKAIHPRRTLSIMVKVRDNFDGMIHPDGAFSKPIDYETWWKLNKGAMLAEEILQKAGVRRDDIVKTSVVVGAHPAGTVRIGELLDRECQTQIKNCYCMDTSIMPDPVGMPPTVTILAMARRLARRLTEGPCADVVAQRDDTASHSRPSG